MEVLKCIARQSFEPPSHQALTGSRDISILSITSDSHEPEVKSISVTSLLDRIQKNILFGKCEDVASLNLIFFPEEHWKKISNDKPRARLVFDYLYFSDAFLEYLLSSRGGWFWVDNGDGVYSFIIKEYLYMLAWSFNMATSETRAMVYERSRFHDASSLRDPASGCFRLPGLDGALLHHPLALACAGLADLVSYLDSDLAKESYRIGDIEQATGYGSWVQKQQRDKGGGGGDGGQPLQRARSQLGELNVRLRESLTNEKLERLGNASQNIATIIGFFANLNKSLDVVDSIAGSLTASQPWDTWFDQNAQHQQQATNKECVDLYREATASIIQAAGLLQQRIRTIKHSGGSLNERARAQSSVISDLISRANSQMAEDTRRDSADMKFIALMTMAFLPATFFAALFAIPTLQWDYDGGGDGQDQQQGRGVIGKRFWVYWAFTMPTTLMIFVLWDMLNDQKILRRVFRLFWKLLLLPCAVRGKRQAATDLELQKMEAMQPPGSTLNGVVLTENPENGA